MIYRPKYVDKIMAYLDTPFVKILTGIRRSGKSTILKMIMEQLQKRGVPARHIISYHFDSMEYDSMTAKQMFTELKQRLSPDGKTYLFLDEVQEIKGWEKVVNTLTSDYDVDIFVAGSNSRMMSSELSTYLTGRYVSFRVFPLSFEEYLIFRKAYADVGDRYREFSNYLLYGGFPAIHLQQHTIEEAYTIVRDIYNSTIYSDIVRRNQIRKVDQLERIAHFTFDNVGKTFSAASISNYLKSERRIIDNKTVYNYLEKLESAYILHRCSRYDVQGKELLNTQEKFYLADSALRYSALGYDPTAMLENIVYLELLRRGYTVCVGKVPDGEIDFIGTRQNNKIYVQVTKGIHSAAAEAREYDRLLNIHDNYPKYILRTDEFASGRHQEIQIMHIADFLLQTEL